MRYECTCEKGNQGKNPDEFDIEVIKKSEKLEIPYWYPQDEFPKTGFFRSVRKGIGNNIINFGPTEHFIYFVFV